MDSRDEDDSNGLEVTVAEMLVATADEADYLIDGSVSEVLKLLRDRMKMDVVFVSELTGGERILRCVDQAPGHEVVSEGQTVSAEETWCQRVVDGRLPEFIPDGTQVQQQGLAPKMPFPVGTYLGTPIVMSSGEVYGTLCCFSFGTNPQVTEQDVKKLRYTAQLTAQKIERSRLRKTEVELELKPLEPTGFTGRL